MNRAALYRALLIAAVCLLTACSSWQQSPPPPSTLTANQYITHWQLSGKIGLRNGKQGNSAYLNWRQCGQAFDIRLTGPLGQGAAHLYGNSHQANLETSDQQTYTAPTPEQLLEQHFGWSLPVTHLLYWLRGIPVPELKYRILAQPHSFEQDRWQLSYPKLIAVDGYQLPAKAIADQAPLKVTLIIKKWQLTPHCEPEK